ncbi:MAG TPA: DUF2252 family protein [Pirellulales bacterium]|nr:DUF2252 family protein [Pirellulales bacterium]
MSRDPVQQVVQYNRQFAGRYPDVLRQKFERMAASPFGFFRGTFHVFAHDMVAGLLDPWQSSNPFTEVEIALVGDIHSENYGVFKAADGLLRFDVNDFDETTRGSFDFDVKRAATSLFLATAEAGMSWSDAIGCVDRFVRSYVKAIDRFAQKGGAADFGYSEKQPPDVPSIIKMLASAAGQTRPQLLKRLTTAGPDDRRSILRTPKYFDLKPEDRAQAERLVQDYARRNTDAARPAEFFQIEDVCGRVAGCGSLGRLRYAVLLAGRGSANLKNALLEFKESLPSAYDLERGRETDVASLGGRAGEVARVQAAMQTSPARWLGEAVDGDRSFQVKAIVRANRIEWSRLPTAEFAQLAAVYAQLLAKCHAKTDEQKGQPSTASRAISAAIADRVEPFVKRVTAFALAYSELADDDHRQFAAQRGAVEQALGLGSPAK